MNNKTVKSYIGDKVNVEASVFLIIIATLEVISGTVGNTVLLLILRKPAPGRRVNSHNLLIANLALANLFSMGYWMPFFVLDLLLGYHPVVNEVHCELNGYLIVILTLVALLSLISISFNRYLQVCHSHLFRRIVTNAGTISWCAFCWVACLAICAPYIKEDIFRYAYIPSIHQCSIDIQTGRYFPVYILIDSIFVVPTVAVAYWNYAILRQWKLTRMTRAQKRATRISSSMPCYSVHGFNKVAAVKIVIVSDTTEDVTRIQSDLEKQPEVQGEVSRSPKECPGNMCNQVSNFNQGTQIGHRTEFNQESKFSQGTEMSQRSKFNQGTEMSQGSKFNQGTEISQGTKFNQGTEISQRSKFNQGTEISQRSKFNQGTESSQGTKFNQGTEISQRSKFNQGTEISQGSKFNQGTESSQGTKYIQRAKLIQKAKFNREAEISQGTEFSQGIEFSQGTKFIRKTKPVETSGHLKELEKHERLRLEKEREVVMSIVGVCLLMFLTYVPVFIIQTVDLFYEVPPPVKLFIFLIFHFNSAINWMVYGSMNRFIRRGCSRYVIKLSRTCKCKTLCFNRVQGQ